MSAGPELIRRRGRRAARRVRARRVRARRGRRDRGGAGAPARPGPRGRPPRPGGGVDRRRRGDANRPPRMRADVLAAAAAAPARALPTRRSTCTSRCRSGSSVRSTTCPTPRSTSSPRTGSPRHDLVVHIAAQESLLAQNLGVPTIDDVDEEEIVARTDALLPRFAERDLDGRGRRCGARRWRRTGRGRSPTPTAPRSGAASGSPATTRCSCDRSRPGSTPTTCGAPAGLPTTPPETRHLSLMSDLAGRILPLALAVAGARARRQDRTSGAHGRRWWRVAGRRWARGATPARRPT